MESNKKIAFTDDEKIALFDGYILQYDSPKYGRIYRHTDQVSTVGWNEFKYSKSYNHLMPVVEKIEGIGNTMFIINHSHCEVTPVLYDKENDCMFWHKKMVTRGASKLSAIYSAVISFIDWYNEQGK